LSGKREKLKINILFKFPPSLFRQLNEREISNSYKFNITTKIIYTYWCRARNLIGEAIDSTRVERKRVPDVVRNLSVVKVDTNSLILNWLSGSNGGENQMFLININNSFNITVSVGNTIQNENLNQSVEIKSNFIKKTKTHQLI
jgi:hypothetical protein